MTGTENALAKVATELVTFNLPALVCPEDARAVIAENLEGLGGFRFEKIKMPSGGGVAFNLVNDDGKKIAVMELKGILLDKYPFKAWYQKSFDEKGDDDSAFPDCFSSDNIHGSGCEAAGIPAGQLCTECPKGQWGSSRKGGRGKDCSDKIRIHILFEENVFPRFIDAPPTSMGNFKDYLKRLSDRMNPFYGVVTTISLDEEKSGGGIAYSKMIFAKSDSLTREERVKMKEYIASLLPSMRTITRESIGETPAAANTVDIDPGVSPGDEAEPY